MFLCIGAMCVLMPQPVSLCTSVLMFTCASSRVPVCTCVLLGLAGDGHMHACPFSPTGGVDDSPCQALPLARWAVTYLWLLF